MKEIIEKYKKGELTVKDCSSLIQFKAGDVISNVYNERHSREPIENCVTDCPIGINRCNTNLGYTNQNYFVETCAEIDRMIADKSKAQMEQPKQYKYEKVEFADLHKCLNASDGGIYQKLTDGTYSQLTLIADLHCYKDELYRRAELTQEELHEQKVEELAKVIFLSDGYVSMDSPKWLSFREDYIKNAKSALEWMKQEG